MTTKQLTDEQIDAHLEEVLRASGSALRHYTMAKTRDDMRAAMRRAIESAHTTKDDNDFPLGKACDLSGEGTCEACQ